MSDVAAAPVAPTLTAMPPAAGSSAAPVPAPAAATSPAQPAAAPVAPVAASVTAPETPAKPKASTIETARAKVIAAVKAINDAKAAASKPVDAPTADTAKPVDTKPADNKPTAEIAMSDAEFKATAKLAKENRELKQRLTKLESISKDAETLANSRKLWNEGKKVEALAALSAADPTEAMSELLLQHLESPTATTEKKLEDKVAELTARIDNDAKAKTEAETKARVEAQYAAATNFATGILTAAADKFVISNRAENQKEAAAKALEKAAAMATEQELTPEDMTPEISRKLLLDAYAAVEAEYESLGKRYSRPSTHSVSDGAAAAPQKPQTPASIRAAVTTQTIKPVKTYADAKAKALEAAKALPEFAARR